MSSLVFDGTAHTLTLYAGDGRRIGQWAANNIVASTATFRYVPNRSYNIIDRNASHRHDEGDTIDGPYGTYGIIRMESFVANGVAHDGVGIHSGRLNRNAQNHPTMGCIRTTEAAMRAITLHMASDPLRNITVQGNYDQRNGRPNDAGDQHPAPQNGRFQHFNQPTNTNAPAAPVAPAGNTPMT